MRTTTNAIFLSARNSFFKSAVPPSTMRAINSQQLQSVCTTLRLLLGVFFLCYCVLYLCACPSFALASAVGAEFIGLIISLIIIRSKVFSIPSFLFEKLPEWFRSRWQRVQDWLNLCSVTVFSFVVIFAAVDFSALGFSALSLSFPGAKAMAINLYSLLPVTYWLGYHPAVSLEILAGALVENKNFKQAEPLYKEVLAIRLKLCGSNSDLVSAVYADMGDLYVRKHDLISAESFYRRSIALGPRTGRGFTALATVLRERGRFAESNDFYLKALALREKIYGRESKQYRDTKRAYLVLLQMIDCKGKN